MTSLEFTRQVSDLRGTLKALSRKFTTDHDDALDLVQDTIFRALTYRDKFVQDTNLKGWLFTIMRNTYINNYRKHQRVRMLRGAAGEPHFLTIKDHHTFSIPDSRVEYKEICRQIDALKDEYSIPFKMHISGYKYHEIAEHLSIPIGTVKNRIHNARQETQRQLADSSDSVR
jgi:RNA polymerase sigma factor (sigma-70 family)